MYDPREENSTFTDPPIETEGAKPPKTTAEKLQEGVWVQRVESHNGVAIISTGPADANGKPDLTRTMEIVNLETGRAPKL